MSKFSKFCIFYQKNRNNFQKNFHPPLSPFKCTFNTPNVRTIVIYTNQITKKLFHPLVNIVAKLVDVPGEIIAEMGSLEHSWQLYNWSYLDILGNKHFTAIWKELLSSKKYKMLKKSTFYQGFLAFFQHFQAFLAESSPFKIAVKCLFRKISRYDQL